MRSGGGQRVDRVGGAVKANEGTEGKVWRRGEALLQ